jgi:hypothetical protein
VIEELKSAKHQETLITAHSLYLVVIKNNEHCLPKSTCFQ